MNNSVRTRLAVLGTMADMHLQPVVYDLNCLRKIVAELAPDLLCAEITRDAWEKGGLSNAALEIRAALAPLVAASDIVLVPVAPASEQFADFTPTSGWRRSLVRSIDRILRWGQRKANRPEAINGAMFGAFCHTLCWLTEKLWTSESRALWEAQNQVMAKNILQSVQRDPGRRVLVAVQCQRLHRILALLRAHDDIFKIISYQML